MQSEGFLCLVFEGHVIALFNMYYYDYCTALMMKKIFISFLSVLIYTHCSNSGQIASTAPIIRDHTIILDAELEQGKSITISYSPSYANADNISYSTELSRRGDCVKVKSDRLNAIIITYEGEELCDNVIQADGESAGDEAEPPPEEMVEVNSCSERQIKIISKRGKLQIEGASSLDSSDDHCESFETEEELQRRIDEFFKNNPDIPECKPGFLGVCRKQSKIEHNSRIEIL